MIKGRKGKIKVDGSKCFLVEINIIVGEKFSVLYSRASLKYESQKFLFYYGI